MKNNKNSNSIARFIKGIPKAELHLHIEGSFEPEMMFEIARRNGVKIKYGSAEEVRKAYDFNNLQEFLDIYYEAARVLITEEDFYDLTWAYLRKAREENVIHTEIFFDPQTHTGRGIGFGTVVGGISRALKDGEKKLGISSKLIMCFLRHLSEREAMKTLEESLEYKELITAVGLDSSEAGNPPSKFQRVFSEAQKEGFLAVAHAGEEGPAEYVREAVELLRVSRIDHGNRALEDKELTCELAKKKIPLTVCPLSNLKLKVIDDMRDHPLKKMMGAGLLAMVNSDDPAYFGGYVNENYLAVAEALKLSEDDIRRLAKNSFAASFLDGETKNGLIKKVDRY